LIDRVIEGAKSQSAQVIVEKVYVNDLDLKFCQGDLSCHKTGKCVIQDDMAEVLEKIDQVDALIVGAPLYRGYIAGQMKVFMDRTSPLEKAVDAEQMKVGRGIRIVMGLLARMIPIKLQIKMMQKMAGGTGHLYRIGKKNSVVLAAGAHPSYIPQMKRDLEQAARELGSFSLMSGGKVVASILADSVAEKGDVMERPELLKQAFEAGKQLASSCGETRG
jgi:FMN-dependent NADH-azoreductase